MPKTMVEEAEMAALDKLEVRVFRYTGGVFISRARTGDKWSNSIFATDRLKI